MMNKMMLPATMPTTAPVLRVVCGTENRTNMFVTLDSGFPFQIFSHSIFSKAARQKIQNRKSGFKANMNRFHFAPQLYSDNWTIYGACHFVLCSTLYFSHATHTHTHKRFQIYSDNWTSYRACCLVLYSTLHFSQIQFPASVAWDLTYYNGLLQCTTQHYSALYCNYT